MGAVPGRTSAAPAPSPVPFALKGLSGVHRRPCLAKASALHNMQSPNTVDPQRTLLQQKPLDLPATDRAAWSLELTHLKDLPQFSHCCRLTFSYWWYMASLKASIALALLGSATSAPEKPTGG